MQQWMKNTIIRKQMHVFTNSLFFTGPILESRTRTLKVLFPLCNSCVEEIMTACLWEKEREKKQRRTNSSKWLCVEAIMLKWKQWRYLLKWKEAIFGLWSQKEKKKTAPQACYLIWMTLWWDITQSVSPSFCPLSASWSTHWLSLHSFSVSFALFSICGIII